MDGGNGIAIFANGDKPNRMPVMSFLRNQIIHKRGWEKSIPESEVKPTPEALKKNIKGPYLDFLHQTGGIITIFEEDQKLFLNSPFFKFLLNSTKNEMYYVGDNTFKVQDYPNYIQFKMDANSTLSEIIIFRDKTRQNKVIIKKEEVINHKTQLVDAFSNNEIDVAIQKYKTIKEQAPDLDFERILNEFGYLFYMENKIEKAIAVLEFNCNQYPDSWNTYDSLGEIYEVAGISEKSIKNYKLAQNMNTSPQYKDRIDKKINELKSSK